MKLLDKIKLIIEARSFYVKKIYVDELCLVQGKRTNTEDWVRSHYKVKRILQYERDSCNYRWAVWYI